MRIVPESPDEYAVLARRLHAIRYLLGDDIPITIQPDGFYPLAVSSPDLSGTSYQTPDATGQCHAPDGPQGTAGHPAPLSAPGR